MKTIKRFLKQIDVFAVPLYFRYKEKNYYATSLGGVFIILFLIVILIVGIYYSIPFLKRKNFTIVYYTQNLSKTEQIKLKASSSNFAYGFDCGKVVNGMRVNDVLKLESRYIIYKKTSNGTIIKDQHLLPTHHCGYKDFYYKYNDAVDYLKLNQYQCLDDNSHTIEGIYSDQIFSYYEFAAVALNGTEQNYKDIDTFLIDNDCKFQFYYTDITFDLVNYKEPIRPYLNSLFIQFDLTLFIKRNIFFMNQYLYNDDYLIWNFGDDDVPDVRILFSRYEEYALYVGRDRIHSNRSDKNNYARIYIRADTKRTDVTRRYQKLMEFYADLSSMMITLYRIMIIFFNYINTFYAMHSVAKRIFFFKDIEKKRHFNFFNRTKNIYELIDLTESDSYENYEEEYLENDFKKDNSNQNLENEKRPEEREKSNLNSNKKTNQTLRKNHPPPKNNIYSKNRREYEDKRKDQEKDSNSSMQSNTFKSKNDNIKRVNNVNSIYRRKDPETNEYMYKNKNISIKMNENIYNLKSNYPERKKMNSSDRTDMETPPRKRKRHHKINYSFNVFEAICASFFYCCLPKNLDFKNNINEKANSIIFKKLDLVSYIRSMILFDIINDTMLPENKATILNFLSRPVISLKKEPVYPKLEFYQTYRRNDFEKYSDTISELVEKPKKENEEKKLISLSNKQLKTLI